MMSGVKKSSRFFIYPLFPFYDAAILHNTLLKYKFVFTFIIN